jgi:hypothetical protein
VLLLFEEFAEMLRDKEQRVGSLAVEGVDGEGQNIRDHRIEDFRREAAPGH